MVTPKWLQLLSRLAMALCVCHGSMGCATESNPLVLKSSSTAVRWPAATAGSLRLSLAEAQRLALTQHSTVLAVGLDRKLQSLQLEVSESEWKPKFTLSGQATRQLPGSYSGVGNAANIAIGSTVKLPISTQLSFGVTKAYSAPAGIPSNQPLTQVLEIVQPLLKGFGLKQATLARDVARLNDAITSHQREQTLDGLYLSVTQAYLEALQAQQQVEVAERGRNSAAASREANEALYATGRIAKLDLLQLDADLAQSEFSLAQVRNSAATAKTRLLQWLGPTLSRQSPNDLELPKSILPLETPTAPGNMESVMESVLQQRLDWTVAQIGIEIGELNSTQAKNESLPQLDFVLGMQKTTGPTMGQQRSTDYAAGLRFSVPLDRSQLNLQQEQATVSLQKLVLAAADLRNQIADEVSSAMRDMAYANQQLVLSEANVTLNKQKLEAEREKFRAGRSSAFQLSSAQEALNSAEVAKVQAVFSIYRAQLEYVRSTGALIQLRQKIMN